MNYAEANFDICPRCEKRRLPKGGPGVSAVCCQHCGLVVEIKDEAAELPKVEPAKMDRQVHIAGNSFSCLECGNEVHRKGTPTKEDCICTNCGTRWQVYNGPRPVYLGYQSWKHRALILQLWADSLVKLDEKDVSSETTKEFAAVMSLLITAKHAVAQGLGRSTPIPPEVTTGGPKLQK